MVLNNLRVFLIFDWLQLVRDFLHTPPEKWPPVASTATGGPAPRQRWPSSGSDPGAAAFVPKTVKSGVVTKRSTVQINQDHHLEVKINITGERRELRRRHDKISYSHSYTLYRLLNVDI